MKKSISLLALLIILSLLPGCTGLSASAGLQTSTNAPTSSPTAANGTTVNPYTKELVYKVAIRITQTTIPKANNLFDQYIKENFNMVWDTECIAAEFTEKMRLQFTTNDCPDLILNSDFRLANELASTGKLAAVDQYLDVLPEYRAIWHDVDGGYDYIQQMTCGSDGHTYAMVTKNPRKVSTTWIYRMGTLAQIGITEMPDTLDGLIALLYKAKEKYPESYPLGIRTGKVPYNGFDFAYGIQTNTYIDPWTDKLVPYGAVTDEYRAILKLFRKFYTDGIISKEFATMTDTKWLDNYTNGLHFAEYTSGIRAAGMNQLMAKTFPDAGFDYSFKTVTANPERGWLYSKENPFFNNSVSFAANLNEDKRTRLLDYLNWSASEEGSWFLSWGVEGKTYTLDANRNPVRSAEFGSKANPSGPSVDQELTYYQDTIFNRVKSAVISISGDTNIRLSEAFSSDAKYRYFKSIPWVLSKETQSEVNLLSSALSEVQQEYMMLFIMGSMDPSQDRDWNKYLEAMDRAGLKRYSEIYSTAYAAYQKK